MRSQRRRIVIAPEHPESQRAESGSHHRLWTSNGAEFGTPGAPLGVDRMRSKESRYLRSVVDTTEVIQHRRHLVCLVAAICRYTVITIFCVIITIPILVLLFPLGFCCGVAYPSLSNDICYFKFKFYLACYGSGRGHTRQKRRVSC